MTCLKGQFLIASRSLRDPNFFRTVVLLVQHDEQGAFGLIVNRPLETSISDAWEQVSEAPCFADGNLHHGGPCEGPVMAIHTKEKLGEIELGPGVHFSTNRENLEKLVDEGMEPVKMFVGYAGWAPGQLEAEVEEGGWLVAEATLELIFDENEDLWDELMQREIADSLPPLDPKLRPEDPSMN